MADMELKPCPFCGSDNIQIAFHGYIRKDFVRGTGIWYKCVCSDCCAEIDPGDNVTIREAVNTWNRRVQDE